MAAGRENFIFFLCPLDGVRFITAISAFSPSTRRSIFRLDIKFTTHIQLFEVVPSTEFTLCCISK